MSNKKYQTALASGSTIASVKAIIKDTSAIVLDNDLIMFKSPTIYSKPIVILKKGKLSKIIKCKNEWCKAKTEKYKGWLKKESLWGLL